MTRMIVYTLGIFVATFLAWVGLRYNGLSREVEAPKYSMTTPEFAIVAHRGGAIEAPENTVAAFDHAVSINPDVMIEMDVRPTKDNVLVVLHDSTVDRTTNGKGKARDLTYDEISKLDAGYNFQNEKGDFTFRGKGVAIPKFEEVLLRYPKTKFIIEIKENFIGVGEDVAAVVKKTSAHGRVIIAGQSLKMISEARRFVAPNALHGIPMTGEVLPEMIEKARLEREAIAADMRPNEWIWGAPQDELERLVLLDALKIPMAVRLKSDFYFIPETHEGRKIFSESLLHETHRQKKKVMIWTVNEVSDWTRLRQLGVDGIITDRPLAMYNWVNSDEGRALK